MAGTGLDRRAGARVGAAAVAAALLAAAGAARAADVRTLTFQGVLPEHRLTLKELANGGAEIPGDWSGYTHLVMEMRTATPQRFALWVYTKQGPRRIEIQPFGEGQWLRASIPLQYLQGMDKSGNDLASTINRRTDAFWMSVWGPFGELKDVEAVGFAMEYPINHAQIELRNVHLSKQDEGSAFLVDGKELPARQMLDEFGQWAYGDWPRKIKSREQLQAELAEEAKHFVSGAAYGYDPYGGYADSSAPGGATGFFRVENVNGKWWFVDPAGHLYLSTGVNGAGAGFGGGGAGRRGGGGTAGTAPAAPDLTTRRLESWGLTTGGIGKPNTVFLRWPQDRNSTFLGMPDVYAENFASSIDQAADRQCTARKDDPLVLGYFIGNEPPWDGRESELVDMILAGPATATQAKLKAYLAEGGPGVGDTPKRRKAFVIEAFRVYIDTICAAVRKHDPHHLIIGTRFGGNPSDEMMEVGKAFDVCSINVYEYEPTKQVERAYRLTGRPVLIGEFHIGVPENGLGAGLVQAMDQGQRAAGYEYYMEQAASLDGFVGAHWFEWRDEPVSGRNDGENYNIGLVDVTDRPYPEMVTAIQLTMTNLRLVHEGRQMPFTTRPDASLAGTPSSPWDPKN
ncbi:MAG TPA: hypothetical protein VH253_18900 [Phycisphaerae bacterium]|nr:hypothetical protein [Phycisphaerae bacterium]